MKTPRKKPGSPLDAIYRRTDLTPEQVFRALSRLRKEAERQVEYLISLIDELDGDTDAEPEPVESNYASNYGCDRVDQDEAEGDAGCDDREQDDADDEDGADDEPSLCGVGAEPAFSADFRDMEEDLSDYEQEDSGIGDFDGLSEQIGQSFKGRWTTYGAVL